MFIRRIMIIATLITTALPAYSSSRAVPHDLDVTRLGFRNRILVTTQINTDRILKSANSIECFWTTVDGDSYILEGQQPLRIRKVIHSLRNFVPDKTRATIYFDHPILFSLNCDIPEEPAGQGNAAFVAYSPFLVSDLENLFENKAYVFESRSL